MVLAPRSRLRSVSFWACAGQTEGGRIYHLALTPVLYVPRFQPCRGQGIGRMGEEEGRGPVRRSRLTRAVTRAGMQACVTLFCHRIRLRSVLFRRSASATHCTPASCARPHPTPEAQEMVSVQQRRLGRGRH